MLRVTRRALVWCLVPAIVLSLAAGAAHGATKPVRFVLEGTTEGLKIQGRVTQGSLGSGTYKGTIVNNATGAVVDMRFKGGTIRMIETARIDGSTLSGTWRFGKATGRFKGIKARGAFSGSLVEGRYTFTGKRRR